MTAASRTLDQVLDHYESLARGSGRGSAPAARATNYRASARSLREFLLSLADGPTDGP